MFDWFQRRPAVQPQQSTAAADAVVSAGSTTSIDKHDFAIRLPFQWREVPRENGFEFHNESLPEQCIIDVQHTRNAISREEMGTALDRLAGTRRDATLQSSGGSAQLSDIEVREGDSQMEARFHGIDEANQVQIAAAIRATPTKFVTISLYRYTLSQLGVPFTQYASLIFDLAQVKDA